MCPRSPAAPGERGRWLHLPVSGLWCVRCVCQQFGFHTWLKPEIVTLRNHLGLQNNRVWCFKYLNMIHTASTCLPSALLSPRCLEVAEKQAETQHKPLPLPHTSSQFSPRILLTPSLPARAASRVSPVHPGLPPGGIWDQDPPLGISPVTQVALPSLPSQNFPFPLADVGLFHLVL